MRAELELARGTATDLEVFARLFEALEAPIGIWNLLGSSCSLIASNGAAEDVLSGDHADALDPPAFVVPDLATRLRPLLGVDSATNLGEFSAPDGSRVYAARGCWLGDDLVGVGFFDITERRKAERDRRRIARRMQHTQKLESLGVLAGGIAHDFNNLLAGIMGNTSLALLDLPADSPLRPLLEQAEATARVASELTRQMLAYSGKGRFVIENLDLSELVEEMARLLSVSLPAGAVLRFDISADMPPVEMDASQVRQVVMNLVTNAADAVKGRGGTIGIRTGRETADTGSLSRYWLADGIPGGEFVFVEVSDTGGGMTREVKARLFDPFFTTKKTGRGLGMAAVLGIVRGHKGAIKVSSEPGQGTTIKVLFPIHPGLATTTSMRAVGAALAPTDALVLVVDDEEPVRTIACLVLERAGCRTVSAANGQEAVDIFATRGDEIDLVLLDLTMPVMDGEETLRALRAIRADIRVLLSSGYNRQDTTARFAGEGLAGFLQKPWTAPDLQDAVARILQGGEDE